MDDQNRWDVNDVAGYLKKSLSWVYKRTAPNTKFRPRIPRIANISHPRFDPDIVKEIYRTMPASQAASSLKIKKVGNLHSNSTTPLNRRFKKL